MGCGLVFMAFVLLRFFFTCPKNIWNRLSPTLQTLFFYFQQILYWGSLITGLILCFLAATKIGFLTLGCFLFFYNMSFAFPISPGKQIPLLRNFLVGLIGIISLVLGLILSFTTSLKYGFVSIGAVLLTFLIVKCLMRVEIKLTEKYLIKYHNYKPWEPPPI